MENSSCRYYSFCYDKCNRFKWRYYYSIVTNPNNGGTVVLSGSLQAIKFQHANFKGIETFTYKLSDGLDEDTGTITVNIYNNIPTTVDISNVAFYSDALSGVIFAIIIILLKIKVKPGLWWYFINIRNS